MRRLKARHLLIGWIVIFTFATAFAVGQNRMLGEQGREAHDALCVFKADLERRARDGRTLLDENQGPFIFGIPRSVIENSIANQQKTIDSLRTLDCSDEGGTP